MVFDGPNEDIGEAFLLEFEKTFLFQEPLPGNFALEYMLEKIERYHGEKLVPSA